MKTKNSMFGNLALLLIASFIALSFSSAVMAEETVEMEDTPYPLLDMGEYMSQIDEQSTAEEIDLKTYLTNHERALPDYLRFYVINTSEVAEYAGSDELYGSPLLNLSINGVTYVDVPQFCDEAYPTGEYRSGGIKSLELPYDIEDDTVAILAVSSFDGSLRYIAQVVDVEDGVSEEDIDKFGKDRKRIAMTFYDNGIAYKTVGESWETRCVLDIMAVENGIPVKYENTSRLSQYWARFSEYFISGDRMPLGDEKDNAMHPVTIVY